MKNVDIKIISLPGKFSMIDLWKNNCILDYGNLKDALHCGASGTSEGNIQRYPNVLSTLQKNGELYLKVYLSNNHNNLQFY